MELRPEMKFHYNEGHFYPHYIGWSFEALNYRGPYRICRLWAFLAWLNCWEIRFIAKR